MAQDYSFSALMDFLDYAGGHGLIKAATARAYRTACAKIYDSLTEGERADVRSIDVEALFQRFLNKNKVQISPRTLRDYRGRLETSIGEFQSWRSDPAGYKPKGSANSTTRQRAPKPTDSSAKAAHSEKVGTPPETTPTAVSAKVLNIPFPLRDGFTANLQLPRDLTTAEAERMGAFLRTLAVDFKP